VLALYVLGKRVWGRQTALPAAIMLAGAHAHLHYSRLGMTNIWDPLLALLAIGAILLAGKSAARWPWLLAGVMIGLTPYFFTTAHLFPLILLGGVATALGGSRRRQLGKGTNALAAALMAAVVALPQALFYTANPALFMDRVNALGIFQSGWLAREAANAASTQTALLWDQFRLAFLGLISVPDASLAYNAGVPILSFFLALFAVFGTGLALLRWRLAPNRWLLVWVVVSLVFGGALLVSPPASHRLLIALPAVCLLAGAGLAWFGQRLGESLGITRRYWLPIVSVIALGIALGDISFYFGPFRAEHRFADRNSEIAFRTGEYLDGLPADEWTAYFHGAPSIYADFPTIPYLADGFVPGVNLFDVLEPGVPPEIMKEGRLAFILVPERSLELNELQLVFPDGDLSLVEGAYADPLLYVYEWPGDG
jgi:4-amino-4-deoxy-L-arabinose transferase-like glycosyltransferase